MKKIMSLLLAILFLTSCASYVGYYKLDEKYLERRQLETRRFEVNNENTMIVACGQVLQDLGFTIEESEMNLGLITASKNREAGSTAGKVALIFLAAFAGTQAVYDTEQKIHTTIVSTKSNESEGFNVRIEFARVIWNNLNQARIEKIEDPEIYQDFFDKLSQSLFLTANNI